MNVTKLPGAIGTAMLCLFAVMIAGIAAVFLIILWNSPGKPEAFVDAKGVLIPESISEKGYIPVKNGRLGYFMKSRDSSNPVLLYLHGGMPDYFLTSGHPTGLDELFTVVWLDQRGAGLSYGAKYDADTPVLDSLLYDVKEVSDYLRKRFSRDKIYLMAHSGGTYLGVKAVEKYPELFEAYIGVAQISYQKLSEKKAYEYILERYKNDPGKTKLRADMILNPVRMDGEIPRQYTMVRDYAMHDLGVGTMRDMRSVIPGLFIPSLLFREYSLRDKLNLWKGKADSGISKIWNELINHDLAVENVSFKIPVYFLHGIYDYTCSYELSKEYFDKIDAPRKGFFTFVNSAHSPIFEEPAACVNTIRSEILASR